MLQSLVVIHMVFIFFQRFWVSHHGARSGLSTRTPLAVWMKVASVTWGRVCSGGLQGFSSTWEHLMFAQKAPVQRHLKDRLRTWDDVPSQKSKSLL